MGFVWGLEIGDRLIMHKKIGGIGEDEGTMLTITGYRPLGYTANGETTDGWWIDSEWIDGVHIEEVSNGV